MRTPCMEPIPPQDFKLLENVGRFALRMVTWNGMLVDILATPLLETRRLQNILCTLYKLSMDCFFFIVLQSQTLSHEKRERVWSNPHIGVASIDPECHQYHT